ncbi:Eukaryotic translation initiation factor 3 subunit C [Lamellibrachia satsuma]|nr:Eukaryotic translation initiation factor 3 subunit C [Lamellibrachia satsuma]
MLTQKIKEESLRTYLFTYSAIYDSLSLITLADMFELELPVVHAIINKMIINEELMASMDEPTHTVVMHRTEPTHLQALALQLSEKVSSLVDYNERTMETKSGIFFFQKQGQQGGYQGYQNRDQGYRGKDRDQQGGYQYRGKDRDQQGGYQYRGKDRDQQGGYQYRGKDRDQQGGYQYRGKDRDQQGGYQGYGGRRPQRQNRY